jgi:hypothetical protein
MPKNLPGSCTHVQSSARSKHVVFVYICNNSPMLLIDGHGVGSWIRHSVEHQEVTHSNPSFVTKHHISFYVFPRLVDDYTKYVD